jgi:hypothetical protein
MQTRNLTATSYRGAIQRSFLEGKHHEAHCYLGSDSIRVLRIAIMGAAEAKHATF